MSLSFLEIEFLQNKISDYLIALAILFMAIITIKILRHFVLIRLKKWAQKTANRLDDAIIRIFEIYLIPIVYLGSFYLAISNLTLQPILDRAIDVLTIILATILGIRFIVSLAEYFLRIYWIANHKEHPNLDTSINALVPAIRTIVWIIGIIFLLDNLGFDISAVVASLGIGGVAIALASQGVLQDLFSYFSILFDRPFELGDFIIVGDYLGTVEYVGIKTTRLKSISGEEIVIANTDLTSSRIRNFKRMKQRRIVFQFGVTYETTKEQLEIIPNLVKNIIENTQNTTFDRAHFSSYGDFSLNFEVVYFINSNDYYQYMDAQQQINLKLKEEFAKQKIEFAYPTQLNYLLSLPSEQSNDQSKTNLQLE
jgi:small-conductance mechanosensitive channel